MCVSRERTTVDYHAAHATSHASCVLRVLCTSAWYASPLHPLSFFPLIHHHYVFIQYIEFVLFFISEEGGEMASAFYNDDKILEYQSSHQPAVPLPSLSFSLDDSFDITYTANCILTNNYTKVVPSLCINLPPLMKCIDCTSIP